MFLVNVANFMLSCNSTSRMKKRSLVQCRLKNNPKRKISKLNIFSFNFLDNQCVQKNMLCVPKKVLSITWAQLQDKALRNLFLKFQMNIFGKIVKDLIVILSYFNFYLIFRSHYSVPPLCPVGAAEGSVKMYHNSIFLGGNLNWLINLVFSKFRSLNLNRSLQ